MDDAIISGFGDESTRFDQTRVSSGDRQKVFDDYFSILQWETILTDAVGFDLRCGSKRRAWPVARRVGTLRCIDPSDAINVAGRNLSIHDNCYFHRAAVDHTPLADASMCFGYTLGILHHIPDTSAALSGYVVKLKLGERFLVYIYCAFGNKPAWFQMTWRVSEMIRALGSKLLHSSRYWASLCIAAIICWPLARLAELTATRGVSE